MRKQLLLFVTLLLFLSLACGEVTILDSNDDVPTIAPTAEPPEEREEVEAENSPRNSDGSGLPPTFTPAPTLPVPTLLPVRTTPTTDPGSIEVYIVQPGDTLREIAESYGVTVEEVAAINNITNIDVIEVGQQLQIPIR